MRVDTCVVRCSIVTDDYKKNSLDNSVVETV